MFVCSSSGTCRRVSLRLSDFLDLLTLFVRRCDTNFISFCRTCKQSETKIYVYIDCVNKPLKLVCAAVLVARRQPFQWKWLWNLWQTRMQDLFLITLVNAVSERKEKKNLDIVAVADGNPSLSSLSLARAFFHFSFGELNLFWSRNANT